MIRRVVPPAHSPVAPQAIGRGVLSLGTTEVVARVETLVRAAYGGRHVALTDSGTSALRLALRAAVRARPGPVALPSYGCYDLLTAAHGADVEIVFYDLDPATLAPDPESLELALRGGSRTLVLAYLHGIPVEIEPLLRLAREYGAWLVEDAAQGHGARLRDRPLGSLGDLSILSFSRGKGCTGGGGGALLAHSAELADALRRDGHLSPADWGGGSIARALVQWLFGRPSLYSIPLMLPFVRVGETVYRAPSEARSMASAACGILEVNWEPSSSEASRRRAVAAELRDRLTTSAGLQCIAPPPMSTPGYLRFPLLVEPRRGSDLPDRELHRLGVLRGYPKVLPEVKPRSTDSRCDAGHGARQLVERLWTLPTHGRVEPFDIAAIVAALGVRE